MVTVKKLGNSVKSESRSGNIVYWLISKEDGSINFEMREVSIPPGGTSSKGSHAHEHVAYILSGAGIIVCEEGPLDLYPGLAVFVPGEEEHQWVNKSETETLNFLCVIPAGSEDFLKSPRFTKVES